VRDFPGIDGTSRLSPFLALGAISIRRVYWAARERGLNAGRNEREQIDTFISELIWREFYYQILANFPYVVDGAYREEFRDIPWSANEDHFRRWREGTTGYPIVDAAMRQLAAEGWMHNRTRMITASFLTKDLHLNWQWGEQVFAGQLIDADLASNNGGWQWTAGTGTDASPWFRIFNPVTQSRKFDPEGVYIRKYLPELRRVPAAAVHEPWTMTRSQQEAAGCIIGRDYPEPVVDHQRERQVTLAMYSQPVR
jgi:deoxyribodipyrimidine photo-lyase